MRCSVFVHMKCNLLKEICNLQKEIWAGPWGSLGIRQSLERNFRSTERNLSRDQVIFGIYTQKFEQGCLRQSTERNLQSTEKKFEQSCIRNLKKEICNLRKEIWAGSYQAVRSVSFLRHPWHLEVPTSPWSPGSCTPTICRLQTLFNIFNDFKLVASDM